jgi:hypothetical protein
MGLIRKIRALFRPQTKIEIRTDVCGRKWWQVEQRDNSFSYWQHVGIYETLKEAMAMKVLLENGHSQYHYFRPSARCEMLNLKIQ